MTTRVRTPKLNGRGERVDVSIADVLATWVGPVGQVRMVDVEAPLRRTVKFRKQDVASLATIR